MLLIQHGQNTTQVLCSQYFGSLSNKYGSITVAGMKYGERLRKAREKRGMTQDDLAKASGVGQGSISKIERGDQESSTHDVALSLALGVSPFWLSLEIGEMELSNIHLSDARRQIVFQLSQIDDDDIQDVLDEIKKINRRNERAGRKLTPAGDKNARRITRET